MRIGICTDHPESVTQINTLLDDVARNFGIDISQLQIDRFTDAESLLCQKEGYHLIFLEIELPAMSGLEAARQLKSSKDAPLIVLISKSTEYCMDAFDIGVDGYLREPIEPTKFTRTCMRLLIRLTPPLTMLRITSNRHEYQIPVRDIIYIESIGRKSIIHTDLFSYDTNLALSSLERTLDTGFFMRCYRSYLINMNYISEILDSDVKLVNGEYIPLTLRKHGQLLHMYHQFLCGHTPLK